MNAVTLCELQRAGIEVSAIGGKLRLSAPAGTLSAAMRERITASRDDLLRELGPDLSAQRARLLALAADDLLPAKLVHDLEDADVAACADYADDDLRGYLRALVGRERMDKGLPPLDWGEPVTRTCEGCGPVLLWAGCPPTVKACPWCFRRKAGKPIAEGCLSCGGKGCVGCRRYRESLPMLSGLVKMPEAGR